MLRQILFGGETGLSPLANAGLTLLRIFAGVSLALAHGTGKLPPAESFIDGTAKRGFLCLGSLLGLRHLLNQLEVCYLQSGFLHGFPVRLSSS